MDSSGLGAQTLGMIPLHAAVASTALLFDGRIAEPPWWAVVSVLALVVIEAMFTGAVVLKVLRWLARRLRR